MLTLPKKGCIVLLSACQRGNSGSKFKEIGDLLERSNWGEYGLKAVVWYAVFGTASLIGG